ncbi:TPA: Mov34/MPN/PAD-1 family protein [Aeromonas salmonicida]|uniref:JAB domain-containing protein n=3 Tax=Aeromonas salmonicida TaxID=645 RepID=A4SJV1_AERS4|nr:Mov34/MPN/PAD-1 family protein [Aeromonas salmonicida]ABO89173.1 conserved hypothetical protein [Aeromonas salmonicida subsp. salmonicida A449]AYO62293.1 peptidase [Aeromonas salmonicida subsp. salmonicida 01-B526]EHI51709.1 hypothetical protein IYQ_15253 [Aeromonas salmonicida subsp. salmonicida 01-B526]EKP0240555.1 Mov34/MPN/PAD-1 family protein [Aeromonas salmonicida]EKP0244737.1 Mov34/MPN/PAD-1 family protein [Aeromonas salmonicida]
MNKNLDLIFSDNSNSMIVIMSNVVEILLSHRQLTSDSFEAAGVLIGERRGMHLVINDLSEPGAGDIRHRYNVDRRGQHHQAKVISTFSQSDGRKQYLGEWHTHPEDYPAPSSTDKSSWARNLKYNKPMIVIIVGRNDIWVGKIVENSLVKLTEM